MRGWINDFLRWLIGLGIVCFGLAMEVVHQLKVKTFFGTQKRLRQRYQIAAESPVLMFGPEIEKRIENCALRAGHKARFAVTSGSTASPKRLLFTKRRLRSVRWAFQDLFARTCWALSIRRKSLYVFSSLRRDDSLTSLLLEENGFPPYVSTLQAPYRVQCHPAIQALAYKYGVTALRLWVLALANPGVLYSTNPSTLSTFLDELATDWQRSSRLIKDFWEKPQTFDAALHRIAHRLESRGSHERLARIAVNDLPLQLPHCAPAVEAYVCWTGGYVKPFLDRIGCYLPAERYRLIPMFSMSTETLETVSHFTRDGVAFLPLASRVLYEFIEEGADDRPENLCTADQLQLGSTYAMVVSDPYGLRRYQTGDLFLCRAWVAGLPDLHFLGRRGLEYSFTGEKLTSEQVSAVFDQLRQEYPRLGSEHFLTCVPSQPHGKLIPHYKVILIGAASQGNEISADEVAYRFDELLGEVNHEYKSKRDSRRLGAVSFIRMPPSDFARRMGGVRHGDTWEAQFKFLPLYRRTWESLEN